MKVVVDANIIISGLRYGGMPRRVLEAANKDDHAVYTSRTAMEEAEEVLIRKFKVASSEWIIIVEALRETLVVIATPSLPDVLELRDKRDLHILAAAELCSADNIVSGDKDLLVLGHYNDIPIVKASRFVGVCDSAN